MAMQMTRRRFLAGTAATAAGSVLAACQPKTVEVVKEVTRVVPGGEQPAGEATALPEPQPAGTDAGPLRVLWVSQTALVESFEQYSKNVFGPKNNGATVEFLQVPQTEFSQKLLSGMAAGDPPDLFREVNYQGFAHYCMEEVILPLDEYIARDNYQEYLDTFLPGSVEAGQFDGKQYCIPFGGHPSSFYLFYNKTALEEKGFKLDNKDWTWAEYLEMVRAMSDPANKVYGTWLRLNLEGFVVGLRSLGTDIIDETGTKSLIGAPEARPFFEMAYKMINEYNAAPRPSDIADWKPPFAAQKIMTANDNGYRESFLREMVEDFEWDTFVTPNESGKPRGVFVCDFSPITSFSKHKDLAWEWVKGTLEVEEGINRVRDARHIPLPVEAALLPEGETISPQYEFYIKEWMANPPLGIALPANGRTTEVFDLLQQGFDSAWLGMEPLDDAIKRVDTEVQKVLDKPRV